MGEEPLLPPLFQSVTISFDVDCGAVMENPIQDCSSDDMITEDLSNREKPKLPEKLGALFHQSRDKSLFFGNISVILLESKGQADRSA